MTDKEPTQKQLKEFAKRCGFSDIRVFVGRPGWDGVSPDGEYKVIELDLKNLFKYAVPKLGFVQLHKNPYDIDWHAAVCLEDDVSEATFKTNPDPALVLFWAIYEAIKKGSG